MGHNCQLLVAVMQNLRFFLLLALHFSLVACLFQASEHGLHWKYYTGGGVVTGYDEGGYQWGEYIPEPPGKFEWAIRLVFLTSVLGSFWAALHFCPKHYLPALASNCPFPFSYFASMYFFVFLLMHLVLLLGLWAFFSGICGTFFGTCIVGIPTFLAVRAWLSRKDRARKRKAAVKAAKELTIDKWARVMATRNDDHLKANYEKTIRDYIGTTPPKPYESHEEQLYQLIRQILYQELNAAGEDELLKKAQKLNLPPPEKPVTEFSA